MNCQWLTVSYLTQRSKLERLLPPGCVLRGDPVVSVSLSYFSNLYWLAGRGYGILYVDVPVTYTGRTETIVGAFCPVLWEGSPDACITGRDELGFAKLFADIPQLEARPGTWHGGRRSLLVGPQVLRDRGARAQGSERREAAARLRRRGNPLQVHAANQHRRPGGARRRLRHDLAVPARREVATIRRSSSKTRTSGNGRAAAERCSFTVPRSSSCRPVSTSSTEWQTLR